MQPARSAPSSCTAYQLYLVTLLPPADDPSWKAVYAEIEFDAGHFGVFENAIDMVSRGGEGGKREGGRRPGSVSLAHCCCRFCCRMCLNTSVPSLFPPPPQLQAHIHYLHGDSFGNQVGRAACAEGERDASAASCSPASLALALLMPIAFRPRASPPSSSACRASRRSRACRPPPMPTASPPPSPSTTRPATRSGSCSRWVGRVRGLGWWEGRWEGRLDACSSPLHWKPAPLLFTDACSSPHVQLLPRRPAAVPTASLHPPLPHPRHRCMQVPEVHVTAKAFLPSTSLVTFTLGGGLSFTTFVNTIPISGGWVGVGVGRAV